MQHIRLEFKGLSCEELAKLLGALELITPEEVEELLTVLGVKREGGNPTPPK